jgi:hypothetical protein
MADVQQSAAERRDPGGRIEGDGEDDVDAGDRIPERDLVTLGDRARLDDSQLAEEFTPGPVERQGRMTGEAAASLGKEVEHLAAVKQAARYGALQQCLDLGRLDVARQAGAPIGQHGTRA